MSEDPKNKDKVNEPAAEYAKQEITFFKSFEEMNEQKHRDMAALTPEQCLHHLELMRRMFLDKHLLPDGSWPLDKVIRMRKPFAE